MTTETPEKLQDLLTKTASELINAKARIRELEGCLAKFLQWSQEVNKTPPSSDSTQKFNERVKLLAEAKETAKRLIEL